MVKTKREEMFQDTLINLQECYNVLIDDNTEFDIQSKEYLTCIKIINLCHDIAEL